MTDALRAPRLWFGLVSTCLLVIVGQSRGQSSSDYRIIPRELSPSVEGSASPPTRTIRIPRKPGPRADPTLVALSERVERLDGQLRAAAGREDHRLSDAQLAALFETRDALVAELAAGQDILVNTSGGEFPPGTRREIDGWFETISRHLSAEPSHDRVTTDISYAGPSSITMAIQFQGYRNAKKQADAWQTYTPGQPLSVGTYFFLVTGIGAHKTCREIVPVLDDPTKLGICATFAP
jgi:hypothetical protein